MNKTLLSLIAILMILSIISCNTKNNYTRDLSKIQLEKIEIKRYEQVMFAIPPDSFIEKVAQYQTEFPVFLDGNLEDTAAILALKSFFLDPYMKELNQLVSIQYKDINKIEEDFTEAFKYFKYYFEELPTPQMYSYVSGLDFQYPIKFVGGSLLIGLDMYLGSETKAYASSGFPQYRTQWAVRETIVRDAMQEITMGMMPPPTASSNLLDYLIFHGKSLLFIKSMLPQIQDSILFKYKQTQLEWINNNEGNIWAYIVENQALFATDKKIVRKFIDDGPFTDLFSKKSPSRLAYYIGFKIVEKFMIESEYSLRELFEESDNQKILRISGYKPKL